MANDTVAAQTTQKNLMTQIKDNLSLTIVTAFSLILLIAIGIKGGSAQIINTIVSGGMWALLAVGLALVFGVMNVPHFAHGESFMVGAYISYFVYTPLIEALGENPSTFLKNIAPFAGVLAAGVAGAILGVIIERLVFAPLRHRTKSGWIMNAFLLTVGLSFVMTNGTVLVLGTNFRGIPKYWDIEPVEILGARMSFDRLVAFFIAVVTIGVLWWFLRKTRTGRAIRAVSQDETGAQLVGINLNFIQTLTFSLATAMAAIAGATLLFMFQAYPTVGVKPLYFAWYVVMLAGLGNVVGAIAGGFIVALLQTSTQLFFTITWETVIPTAVMVLVLLIAPSGLFGSEVKSIQEQ
ncbi:MAG: branched-chain amino acid ABC transporter permease [Chloroflexota bacterium]|nr:branched-chain amino acid ABC transporter permease [Chloroflexota bacterium]